MTLKRVQAAHIRWLGSQIQQHEAREKLRQSVKEARQTHTLAEIGEVLGMTRQGVYDLLKR